MRDHREAVWAARKELWALCPDKDVLDPQTQLLCEFDLARSLPIIEQEDILLQLWTECQTKGFSVSGETRQVITVIECARRR